MKSNSAEPIGIRKGDKVRHKKSGLVRTVVGVYEDIDGGVLLDKQVWGFFSWNVLDLELVERRENEVVS